MSSYFVIKLLVLLTVFVFLITWLYKKYVDFNFDDIFPDIGYSKGPDECEHENWSSRYDYRTHPGSVMVREARCLDCGIREQGSGQ